MSFGTIHKSVLCQSCSSAFGRVGGIQREYKWYTSRIHTQKTRLHASRYNLVVWITSSMLVVQNNFKEGREGEEGAWEGREWKSEMSGTKRTVSGDIGLIYMMLRGGGTVPSPVSHPHHPGTNRPWCDTPSASRNLRGRTNSGPSLRGNV
jgi:hypothetical protein